MSWSYIKWWVANALKRKPKVQPTSTYTRSSIRENVRKDYGIR